MKESNATIKIYVNNLKNKITFKIKDGNSAELLRPATEELI